MQKTHCTRVKIRARRPFFLGVIWHNIIYKIGVCQMKFVFGEDANDESSSTKGGVGTEPRKGLADEQGAPKAHKRYTMVSLSANRKWPRAAPGVAFVY